MVGIFDYYSGDLPLSSTARGNFHSVDRSILGQSPVTHGREGRRRDRDSTRM
jgi:hypothetical protein